MSSYFDAMSIEVTPTNWRCYLFTDWLDKNQSIMFTVIKSVSALSLNL